eukprot:gene12279-biopygen8585
MSDLEMTSTMCSAFTIPESHQSKGVYGYDVVLRVAAPTSENIMAVADACYKMSNGCPVFAALDVPAGRIEYSHNAVRELARHEMAHALGSAWRVHVEGDDEDGCGCAWEADDAGGRPRRL